MIPFDEMTYSIVIPAYNEGQRLGETLEKVLAYVRQQRWDAEVIVVNDGSRDNTAQIVRAFAEKIRSCAWSRIPATEAKATVSATEF